MNIPEFAHLHSVGMDCCTLEKNVGVKKLEGVLCPECRTCQPSTNSVDVQIQESHPPGPITFVNGPGIIIVNRDFWSELDTEKIRAHVMIGAVYGASNELMSDWITVRGRYRLLVRGSKHVSYRSCKVCGQQFYFAMGQRYLYPIPPSGIPIFESNLCGLIVSPEVLDGVSLSRWRKLGVEKLKVLSQAKDSLGELSAESYGTAPSERPQR